MPCSNCGSSVPVSFNIQLPSSDCLDCNSSCSGAIVNSQCVVYTGPTLFCSGIESNDSLETILQKIDTQICFVAGNYGNYQFNCLTDWYGVNITQENQFVDAITGYACETRGVIDEFVNEAFPQYEDIVNTRFLAIENPGITCSSANVDPSFTLNAVLNAYCTKFEEIDAFDSFSGVSWNTCYTVASTPTTLGTAFNTIINQICQTKALAQNAVLPTFNNSGSCIGGGSSDSLITTIGLIKTRLCATGTFDSGLIGWGCLDDGSSTTLQASFQNLVSQVSTLYQGKPTFSGDFVITQTNPSDPCAGVTVSLATSITSDRFVASNDADGSPGTLISKLAAGTGITIVDTTPGVVTISSSGTTDTFEVKADSADDTPGFLDQKVNGSSDNGVSLSPVYNAGTKKLDLILSVDPSDLFNVLLDRLLLDTELYNKFCERVANCPSPCAAPTNVQAVQITTTTTLAP